MFDTLKKRSSQQEYLDDFHGNEKELEAVFKDINRVNRLLGGNNITIRAVGDLLRKHPKEQFVILDVGCGDGTILRKIAQYCRKHDFKARLIGIDLSVEALNIARSASTEFPEISYKVQDVLALRQTDMNCDILISTLTTHHFTNEQLPLMLAQFARLAKIGFVNNDLHRSRLALYLFKLFSMVFIKTSTARSDGLISIRRGFKKRELIDFAQKLPNRQHLIKWKWAFRYVWIMQSNSTHTP